MGPKNKSALILIKIVNNKGFVHDGNIIPKTPSKITVGQTDKHEISTTRNLYVLHDGSFRNLFLFQHYPWEVGEARIGQGNIENTGFVVTMLRLNPGSMFNHPLAL